MSGTAGVTLLAFGCVGMALGPVGGAVALDDVVGGMVEGAAGGTRAFASDVVCVVGCGAGVELLLGCFDPALLSTGSSEVG